MDATYIVYWLSALKDYSANSPKYLPLVGLTSERITPPWQHHHNIMLWVWVIFDPMCTGLNYSRCADGLVKHFIRPAIPRDTILDQFAFKPSGSTTSALVGLQHHVTYLLETNSYVRCLIIDFSKAFDTINHSVLLSKFCSFGLPANILTG